MKKLMALLSAVITVLALFGCGGGGGGGSSNGNPAGSADTTAPSVPAGLTAATANSSSIACNWNASTDNVGVTGYKIYRNGIQIGTTATTSYTDTGLASSTTYTYTVAAFDAALNTSAQSASAAATTLTVISTAATYTVPDTGQTQKYTTTFGEDSDYTINPPSFTDNANGTVTENVTNLTWQKQDDGTVRTWDAANSYCSTLNLGGYNDWRLPTRFELNSIVDYGVINTPLINSTYFPGTQRGGYWALNESAYASTAVWFVYFGWDWGSYIITKTSTLGVRCVRGDELPQSTFTDKGDGTIADNVTGLMWQKQDDGTKRTWEQAISYCEGLTYAGYSDWRLPNVNELVSIVDLTKNSSPAINTTYFPNTQLDYYWSSTVTAPSVGVAWPVDFLIGRIYYDLETIPYYTRCVRGQ